MNNLFIQISNVEPYKHIKPKNIIIPENVKKSDGKRLRSKSVTEFFNNSWVNELDFPNENLITWIIEYNDFLSGLDQLSYDEFEFDVLVAIKRKNPKSKSAKTYKSERIKSGLAWLDKRGKEFKLFRIVRLRGWFRKINLENWAEREQTEAIKRAKRKMQIEITKLEKAAETPLNEENRLRLKDASRTLQAIEGHLNDQLIDKPQLSSEERKKLN
jgi:hypothetical protein